MMQSNFTPASNKTLHVGAKRNSTIITWEKWHQLYTPNFVRCLLYKDVAGEMREIHERVFAKTGYTDSVVHYYQRGYSIILLEWRDDDLDGKANSFLNNFLPIEKSQRFHDGIVGIGLGRWLKSLFMTTIVKTDEERARVSAWFHDLVRFTTGLLARKDQDKWFDVIRTTLRTNDSVEDILVLRLMQAILGVKVPRQRIFRWFETSIQRAYRHHPQLRDGMLTPMVWLYTDFLLEKDVPDAEALTRAFQHLMGLAGYTDLEILRLLLGQIFPEVLARVEAILEAIRARTAWSDTVDTVFTDGSIIGRTITEMPYGIRMIKGIISIAPDQGDTFLLSVAEYNNYTPFMIQMPENGTEFQFTVTGRIIPPDRTSRYGPGMVCRAMREYAKSGKDFMGILGLSLIGGRGNGRTAPTNERQKPAFLLHPPPEDEEMEIATIQLSRSEYLLMTAGWITPLKMTIDNADTVFAIFLKGFHDIKIRVQPRVHIATPTIPSATAAPTITISGVRFSDLVNRVRITT